MSVATKRTEYKNACRNYRMSRMNMAHIASDRFDIPYYKQTEFVKVSLEMSELGKQHTIMGSVINEKHYYANGKYNNRLYWLLRQARKN